MSKPPTELRQSYINELTLRGCSERTIEVYVGWVYDLARYFKAAPDTLSDEQLKVYLVYLNSERHLRSSSIRQAVYSLRSFYELVLHRCPQELKSVLVIPRLQVRRPEVYSVQEIEKLLTQGTPEIRDRAFLATIYSAGLRLNEACHLKVKHLLSERHQIRVEQGKGGKDRYTILSERLLELLREYWSSYRPETWLFPAREDKSRPMVDSTAQRMFYRALERAGLSRRGGIHALRHSFATHLLEAGVNLPTLQRLLGHSYLGTTAEYLHVRMEPSLHLKSPLNLIDIQSLKEG